MGFPKPSLLPMRQPKRNGRMVAMSEQPQNLTQSAPKQAGSAPGETVRSLFMPPILPDAERTRVARIVHTVLLIMLGATLLAYLTLLLFTNPWPAFIGISGILASELIAFALLRSGRERVAALVMVTGLWLGSAGITLISEGLANSGFIAMFLVVVIAGLTLGAGAGMLYAALSTITGLVLLVAKLNNLLIAPLIPLQQPGFLIVAGVIFFAAAGLIALATNSLKEAVEKARLNEHGQATANRELEAIRATLEEQVKSRTNELQQRSSYLQAAIEVSHATASILNPHQLMNEAVELIRSQFGLYYVGLFIQDPSNEWAILRAGTGRAGQAMIARGHRIQYGAGMVGWSIANAQPRIAADIEKDSVRLATAELPETRSEAAFPLRSRGKVLGAMTVQSVMPEAFGETEISAFQSLADQLAIGLDNASLFDESQRALREAQQATQQASRTAWEAYLRSGVNLTFRYDDGQIVTLADQLPASEKLTSAGAVQLAGASALASRRDTADQSDRLSLPISVRDQKIGLVHFSRGNARQNWTEDELVMLTTIVEQLGVALDSSRLYAETQQRAEQERLVGEITSRMRETLDVESVLQTAAEEIYQTLNLENLVIQLLPTDGQPDEPTVESK
jgi:GAF domain-containing protein